MTEILVADRDVWSKPITVQTITSEGEVLLCNHDGFYREDVIQHVPRVDQPDIEWRETVDVCDKCGAYRLPGDYHWQY